MGVDLGGGDIRVPQHLLNGAQVSAVFQQMHREAVPQRMGRHVLADLRFRLIMLDDFPEPLTGHTCAVHVDEQGSLRLVRDDAGTNRRHILPQRLHGGGVQGDDPLLTVAGTVNEAHWQVYVLHVQVDQLRHTDTGGVQ